MILIISEIKICFQPSKTKRIIIGLNKWKLEQIFNRIIKSYKHIEFINFLLKDDDFKYYVDELLKFLFFSSYFDISELGNVLLEKQDHWVNINALMFDFMCNYGYPDILPILKI